MKIRSVVKAGYAAALSVLLIVSCARQKDRPNILFIAVDDLNSWVGIVGGHPDALTPHMDRLGAQGTVFTNAHCQAPICGPSRASLMTGLLPSTTGIYGMIDDNAIVDANAATRASTFLPAWFKQNGYKTMGVGKLFHEHAPDGLFDLSGGRVPGFGPVPEKRMKWQGTGGADYGRTSTDWGAFPDSDDQMPDSKSADWAAARLAENHDSPFFLAVGFLRPHVPWHVPQKWFDLHPVDSLQMPPWLPSDSEDWPEIARRITDLPMMPTTEWAVRTGEWKNIVQAYLACVSFVDDKIGEVLTALDNSSYADNTIVVLWSDHGYHIGEKNRFAKHSLWEEAARAPLMLRVPGGNSGQISTKPVGMIDIYPTLLDLAGLAPNPQNEGHTLRPLLENPGAEWEHAAITTYGRNNHGVRTEHMRYIRYEDGSEELYDHRTDPHEWRNLAGTPAWGDELLRHRAKLPKTNEPWAEASVYDYNRYFKEHRLRELE